MSGLFEMEGTGQAPTEERTVNVRKQPRKSQPQTTKFPTNMHMPDGAKGAQPLNCIVDDSALLAGLKDRGPDSLKQWIHGGAINLFVPLYTLERLNQLRSIPSNNSTDARKALEWLDHITNTTENRIAGRVELQGPDDQYMSWQDVENYLLPDTPLSSHHGPDGLDGINEAFERNLRLNRIGISKDSGYEEPNTPSTVISGSPDSSPGMTEATPAKTNGKPFGNKPTGPRTTAGIPARVRPLLNYVVWRTYNQDPSIAGVGRYILLTNEAATQKQAQKFGVRAKMLSQVRTIVAREEKRTGVMYANMEPQEVRGEETSAEVRSITPVEQLMDDDEDDEILFQPAHRPSSSRGNEQGNKMWDPDHFGRTPMPVSTPPMNSAPSTTKKMSAPSSPRNANIAPVHATSHQGAPTVNRGGVRGNGQRGQMGGIGRGPPRNQFARPIDPNSYVRPPPSMRRGRGGFRKLWEPTT